jgi:cold shock CspA family protein
MPIKIYDIAKKLGLENKEILAKAKAMGIAAAKVPSSSLDKISGEWLEEELLKDHPPKPRITITATGAELYRLVERIAKEEIQFRFDISETEYGEPLRLCLIKDPSQKPPDAKPKLDLPIRVEIDERTKDLLRAAYYASRHNSTEGWVNLADYGNAVKKLDATFQPQDFGERSLGSLLRRVANLFEMRNDESDPKVYFLRMKQEMPHLFAQVPSTPAEQRHIISAPPPELAKGKVHNLRLGFGFIMPDDGSENLFFHATDVEGCTIFDLKPGDAVEYEPGMNEKGPCGRKVRRLA